MVKLYKCDCEWEKDPDVRTGTGYRLKKMCSACQQQAEQDRLAETQREQDEEKEVEIQEKLREIAIAELEKEGKV